MTRRWYGRATTRSFADLPLLVAMVGAPFGETFLAPGITGADVALGLACGTAIAVHRSAPWRRFDRALVVLSVALVLWVVVDAFLVRAFAPFAISTTEVIRSLAKLLFYLSATILLAATAARDQRPAKVRLLDVLLTVLAIHACVGLYGAVAASTEVGLPYRFLHAGTPRGDDAIRITLLGQPPVHRVRGVAGEPTYFGWFQATGLGLVLLAGAGARGRAFAPRCALVIVSIVGSLSLVGNGLLALALLLAALSRRRSPRELLRILAPAAGLVLAAALLWPAVRASLQRGLVERVGQIAAGNPDPSSSVHLAGSWELTASVLRQSPWLGSALGNYDLTLNALGTRMSGDPTRGPQEIGWNAFALVLGSLGPPGLLIFVCFFIPLLRRDPWAGGLVLACAWGNSTVLGAPFWVLYLLAGLRSAGEATAAAGDDVGS